MARHPVRLVVRDDLRRSRLTVLLRLLLAIPHFIWFFLFSIGAFFVAIVAWVWTLISGRLDSSLHGFFSAYVGYAAQLTAYLYLAANPYPPFLPRPDYPVAAALPEPEPQRRWTVLLRLPLALPALVLASVLLGGGGGGAGTRSADEYASASWNKASAIGVAAVAAFLAWFASLALGRTPRGLRDLIAYCIGYNAQAWSYLLFLTGRYPNSDPMDVNPEGAVPPHAVTLRVEDGLRRSRLTVFFRWLLVLPHVIWLLLWGIAAFFAGLANGLATLFAGRPPAGLHRFLSAYVRYQAHVTAFLYLVANPFPGFTGGPYPVDVAVAGPDRQNRWVTLFRLPLAFPALLLTVALAGALFVAGVLGWFASLFTGRMPQGLRNLGAAITRYGAQVNAYLYVLTDRYPYSAPWLRTDTTPEPETQAA